MLNSMTAKPRRRPVGDLARIAVWQEVCAKNKVEDCYFKPCSTCYMFLLDLLAEVQQIIQEILDSAKPA